MEEIKVTPDPQPESGEGKKTLELVIFGLAIGFILVVSSFYLWSKYSQKQKEVQGLKERVERMENNQPKTEEVKTEEATETDKSVVTQDEYVGWKTYTNIEIGYSLRYPSDWTVEETSEKSEVTDMMTKYITIRTPDKKYFLYFGFKAENDDSFSISGRTGVGAGEIKTDTSTVTILGTECPLKKLVYQSKIQEIFFCEMGQKTTADGKYVIGSSFSASGDLSKVGGINLDLPEIAIAKKILESVKIVEKSLSSSSSGADCVSMLTDSDKLAIATWKKYTNSKHEYSLKYPQDLTTSQSADKDTANFSSAGYGFSIITGDHPFGIEGYVTDGEKDAKIACASAKVMYLKGAPNEPGMKNDRMITANFSKDGKGFYILFNYKYVGASLSSDMVEAFDLMIKTIEF